MSEAARALYDQLRALEFRARRARGNQGTRREAAKAAARPPYDTKLTGQRISSWLPDNPERAQVPSMRMADQVWALVRVWSDWAGDRPQSRRYWNNLIENAQPGRSLRPPENVLSSGGAAVPEVRYSLPPDSAAFPGRDEEVVRQKGWVGSSLSTAPPPMPSARFNSEQAKLFISYSHRDERYLKALKVHLAGLRRQGLIADWYDRMITPGKEWRQAIDDSLDSADCVLLLVTPDFIASDYCYSVEMERALQKHRAGRMLVLPVIVRPTDWQHTPLSGLQAVPKDGKPVVEWAVRDRAWLDVTAGLRLALSRFTQKA